MKISPIDIQQQQFKGKMFGGLDPADVDSFLQSVASEMENLIRENHELKDTCASQARDIGELAAKERELRETLLAAQRITEEMKINAKKEATLVVSDAELKGERIVADAERRLAELKTRIEETRLQKIEFEMSFKALLESYQRMLQGHESH